MIAQPADAIIGYSINGLAYFSTMTLRSDFDCEHGLLIGTVRTRKVRCDTVYVLVWTRTSWGFTIK